MDNPLAMSDADFLNLSGPPKAEGTSETETATETQTTETQTVEPVVETTPEVKETATELEVPVVTDDKTKVEVPAPVTEDKKDGTDAAVEPTTKVVEPKAPVVSAVTPEKKTETADKTTTTPEDKTKVAAPNYENFYKQIMAPLKANGKTIELKSPEEAIQLMQMGANYTKKMQAITPYRKVLTMLENNALLDENKLSFLIDLDKRNPEAIKKLIKESGIDPLDLDRDKDKESAYLEGNHRVSDEEVGFKTAVDELRSNPQGLETLQQINTWDQASKEVLWKNPELMEVMHKQRELGIYDQITAEIDRRRTLGTIAANVPFLHAYKLVGDEFHAAGAFKPRSTATTQTVAKSAPVATRVATPKPAVTNNAKASAASSTRGTPKTAENIVNPLSMSDDDFLKQFAGRV